jgi:hypothetical protein
MVCMHIHFQKYLKSIINISQNFYSIYYKFNGRLNGLTMRFGKSFHQCCPVITYDILNNKQILHMDNNYGYAGSQILVAPWLNGLALT